MSSLYKLAYKIGEFIDVLDAFLAPKNSEQKQKRLRKKKVEEEVYRLRNLHRRVPRVTIRHTSARYR